MAAKAFVLIEAEPAKAKQIVNTLKQQDGIKSINAVTGPYDIIAVVEKETLAEIGELITSKIQAVPGISRTVTCLVI